ncbi:MAG: sigma-54-dependent Fis family transcriptional regulator [Deltaproteobacteria bacterium]|nr:sigma-54-dependent Fis family transcriptional regulator [Deltaproteobacteria bacterium]
MFDGMKVLYVEDDAAVRSGSEQALALAGYDVLSRESAEEAMDLLSSDFPGILLTDVKLPGMDGMSLLKGSTKVDPELPVILVTGHGDVAMAVQAMRDGAYDFVEKPYSSEQLVDVVRRAMEKRRLILENRDLRRKLENRRGIEASLVGCSPSIDRVRRLIMDLADTSADVLIVGATGTGKELVARCLHEHGSRRHGNFVALNCGAMPEAIFESEMFGHEAGAFTGASKCRIGKVEHAHGGTLFLDEIESMPLSLQVKLLRVLQERRLERLGSNEQVQVDCRVISATKQDLKELSDREKFRGDLYYRLSVVVLDVPPLRERREDIPLLFEHFVLEAAMKYNRPAPIVSGEQMRELMARPWPGNVRELRNMANRFVLGLPGNAFDAEQGGKRPVLSLSEQVEAFERSVIEEELRRQGGNVSETSEALHLPKKTLYDKMRKYNLTADAYR